MSFLKNIMTAEQIEAGRLSKLAESERAWRDAELNRADVQLNKVQDGISGLGIVTAWRQYRTDLRNLPDVDGFPTTHVRPLPPDAVL